MVLPPIARRTPPTAVRGPLMAQPPQDTRRPEFTLRVVGWHHAPALRAGEGVDCEVRIPRAAELGFCRGKFCDGPGRHLQPPAGVRHTQPDLRGRRCSRFPGLVRQAMTNGDACPMARGEAANTPPR